MKNSLEKNEELEKVVSEALSAHGKKLEDLYKLEEHMPVNNAAKEHQETSLSIKVTKGGEISSYGLLYEHQNKEVEHFELCTNEFFEEFKTERSHKIFMKGHANIPFKNPLLPSRIHGYDPYLATAYDVTVPDKADSSASNTMRLWKIGSIYDNEEELEAVFERMQEKHHEQIK